MSKTGRTLFYRIKCIRPWTVIAVVSVVIFASCDEIVPYTDAVELNFDNRTDSLLCYYGSLEEALASKCQAALEPRGETEWSPGCGYGDKDAVDRAPITVILAIKESGRQIYSRTEACRVWNDADRTIVIEQEEDEFIITDSFSDSTPGP